MSNLITIQVFVYLQFLDFVTTMVGFSVGAGEASPFIGKLMHLSSPAAGVGASKVLALVVGGICLCTNRSRIVGWINYWYAGLVLWNLMIIMAAITRHPTS